jgi:hypothetical protein
VLLTPVQAPNANAYAERWIGTVRRRVPGLAADYGTKALGASAAGLHRVLQRPSPALGRSGWHRQVHPMARTLSAMPSKVKSVGTTASAVSCTSTGEQHKHIREPRGVAARHRGLYAGSQTESVMIGDRGAVRLRAGWRTTTGGTYSKAVTRWMDWSDCPGQLLVVPWPAQPAHRDPGALAARRPHDMGSPPAASPSACPEGRPVGAGG